MSAITCLLLVIYDRILKRGERCQKGSIMARVALGEPCEGCFWESVDELLGDFNRPTLRQGWRVVPGAGSRPEVAVM